MGSSIVFVLVLLGYNSITNDINLHRTMSWHISQSDCIRVMSQEQNRGRTAGYNQNYVCLRVNDPVMRIELENNQNRYPRRDGSGRLLLRW